MLVFLFGYRGSGKTTVGRLLAKRMGVVFYDVDEQVMARFNGMTIAEIWEKHGEGVFREMECKVTEELCRLEDGVISLGGGTVMQEAARRAIGQVEEGVRIYLYASPEVLWRRIEADEKTKVNRPSLTAGKVGLQEVEAVLAKREPVYRAAADWMVDVGALTAEQVVEQVVERLKQEVGGQG